MNRKRRARSAGGSRPLQWVRAPALTLAPLSLAPPRPGVVLDFNANNQVVGAQILQLSLRAPRLEPGKLVSETTPAAANVAATRGSRPLCGSGPQP
jgi:hypothetical protein